MPWVLAPGQSAPASRNDVEVYRFTSPERSGPFVRIGYSGPRGSRTWVLLQVDGEWFAVVSPQS